MVRAWGAALGGWPDGGEVKRLCLMRRYLHCVAAVQTVALTAEGRAI